MLKRYSCSLLLLLPFMAMAQSKKLSLEEAVATALEHNYDILLSKNDSAAAALDYSFRNAAFLPRLNANVGTVWNNVDQKQILSDGSIRKKSGLKSNNLTAQLALNWTLFDGLKMFATRDKLNEYVALGDLGIKNNVVNTVANVINTYYNIVQAKQQLHAIEEQMSINEERLKLAQYKFDIGSGAKPDVLQSKVDLNAQKAAQWRQQTVIAQLKDELSNIMNVQPAEYDVADSIPLNYSIGLGDILGGLETGNPGLLIAKKNIDIAGLTLKERKAEALPTLSFNTAYNFNRTRNQAVINTFSTLFNRTEGPNFGFTLSVPVLNNLTNKRNIRQAMLDIDYQKLSYDRQKALLNLAVLNAFKNYEFQKKELALEEENINYAKENVDIVLQVYKLGATTLLQLKEAQKSLEDAYNRLILARYNTKVAETELLRLKGELVK